MFPIKAVILAGGEGSRLRPLTLGRPKPMTPLLGKPVLGHMIDLLCRHGVTEIAVTLRYLPRSVTDWFGDGSEYGVHLVWFTETSEKPLGTAGSVRQCLDFLGEEDFYVVSGDAVCDLDLTALAAMHRSRNAAATLALCARKDPREYGLVRTAEDGRILGFLEKPDWGQVDTELVNTGIYVLTRRVLEQVPPETEYDFGRDLFPKLLDRGEALYGWRTEDYWQDMGDCKAYLSCCIDALAGKVCIDPGEQFVGMPRNAPARIVPPSWIGARAELAPGCIVGPYAVIGDGSTVATGAVVERSVLLGASVGEGAEVTGAILCRGAAVHHRAMLNPGVVLGEGAVVESEAIVAPGVRLWPGRRVREGGRATSSQLTAAAPDPIRFGSGAAFRGTIGEELTPEALLLLGNLLGELGQTGLGWSGGEGAALLGRAAICGVSASGSRCLISDASCPSAAAWFGQSGSLPISLFIRQDGDSARLFLTGPDGLPPERSILRRLEGAMLRGEVSRVPGSRTGPAERVSGACSGYARAAAEGSRLSGFPLCGLPVWVPEGAAADDLMARALSALGCRVRRGEGRGFPVFSAGPDGDRLMAWDEQGTPISPDRLLVLLARIEWEDGGGSVCLPPWAPAAADELAKRLGGSARLLRLGRDGPEARALWEKLPWFRDGIFAACRICARLGLTGESLSALDRSLPAFVTVRREIPVRSGQGSLMSAVLESDPNAVGQGIGLRSRVGEGWVYLVPMGRRSALRLVAEAASMEAASELCTRYESKLRGLDEKRRNQR